MNQLDDQKKTYYRYICIHRRYSFRFSSNWSFRKFTAVNTIRCTNRVSDFFFYIPILYDGH